MKKRRLELNSFSIENAAPWKTYLKGGGSFQPGDQSLRLINAETTAQQYTNAQLDDYQGLRRRQFLWQPPLQMEARARFSHPMGHLRGTAGFGFWNDPFLMTGFRAPTLPRAVWFFYASPPSNMQPDLNVPGFGWKAATIDALRWPFFALAPFSPLAIPLMNIPFVYRLCWPLAQRLINISETLLPVSMTDWHVYKLVWRPSAVSFSVDGRLVLTTSSAPRGPLGFVMWLDNQYMVITPWGKFKYGLLEAPGRQWMEIGQLAIATLD